ncbi:MAG: phosphodiesterase, partial [Clostridia bacterium]|nr:phosphodiesterase [Clostridia bacterium]
MKILIASDLHGSSFYAKKIVEILKKENAEKIVLLGDIYNHGPRNSLPKDYSPMEVAKVLNGVKDNLIVIKGNCDSAVDTMISEFDFIEDACIIIGGKSVFLTHGHVYNKDNMPKTKYNVVIYG